MVRVRRPSPQTAAVLSTLAAAGAGWSHGYDLCRVLGLKAGTVYPILIRLAERGLVETSWETGPPRGRPARHRYRLSPDGAELARALAEPSPARAVARVVPRTT
ncbi:PadR family transcriptional regulator [Actinoplanes sp. TBRC 11911]|uniref:PadR family transcriptional regulator n=1 Tax=Actinoplanes sp. TBRC 11911 TaxID=2729386 RepID=UPI00145D2350|nr:PadR family transcriptional regulator [Actinoplanes sp. TBRC 11911]NMO53223.1 PadR family transcriptional regulator [Actinoplanes sp. TBRC 11911]